MTCVILVIGKMRRRVMTSVHRVPELSDFSLPFEGSRAETLRREPPLVNYAFDFTIKPGKYKNVACVRVCVRVFFCWRVGGLGDGVCACVFV